MKNHSNIDPIDRKILELLQDDASRSLAEIAEAVNLSTTPCWRRIQRLEADGVITGRVAVLDPDKINVGITVFAAIKTDQHNAEWLADFAREVRKALFTFAHIPERVDGRDASKITRAVDESVLVNALAYARGDEATDAAAAFLLGNMSSRLADSLREMIDAVGKVSARDGEEALTAMVIAARDLAESGEITLLRPGEGDEEDG